MTGFVVVVLILVDRVRALSANLYKYGQYASLERLSNSGDFPVITVRRRSQNKNPIY